MRSYRRKQTLTLTILMIAVVTLSIGFSAFSSTLRIQSSASVTPDSGNFSVKFSTTQDSLTVAEVEPYSITSGLTATNGVIDNSGVPSISNLSATFTQPGDYVTYRFYVRNEGEYIAYLNSITFNGTKKCTAKAGTTESMAQDACEDIIMTVKVGDTSATATTLDIIGETLNPNEGKLVEIKVEYLSDGALSDGDFSIEFSDITLYYGSTTGLSETVATDTCKSVSVATSGSYTNGDKYTCAVSSSESYDFYVLSDNGDDTVTLLMGQNLGSNIVPWDTLGNVEGSISSTEYLENQTASWTITENISMPSALQIGCSDYNFVSNSYCNGSIPTWAQGVYWTSTIYSDIYSVTDQEYGYSTTFYVNGNYIGFTYSYDEDGTYGGLLGVRPVITVDKTKLIQ